MYVKFTAAIICIILCSLNVVAAVKRTPIRTTLEGSTRTTVEMMPSPNSSVHWLSAAIFIAGFASFLSWGVSDYNESLEKEENRSNTTDANQNIVPENSQSYPSINPTISGKNIIQFTPRVSDNLETKSQTLSPEEFYSQLQQEDYWDDNEDTNNKPSAS
ncbi:hypothetical protein [Brunnivagina elsteri]|uniref:Uncharacterized protein n=1 Tax=Brunnivagina elsteri CCALA 953 TaxID=987040 RepID=A0A2A2TCF4_9CYAN|nr:hypothetical protein [Calothrix elsteri]PAX51315.1 hypothetical protein CK510_25420 [Calothrix elsteri CCALA 953]